MTVRLTYLEQLRHPNWQRRRLERLQQADFSCEVCADAEQTLHVHHRKYVKGRMAWEYNDNELRVVCETCHEVQHFEREVVMAALLMTHAAVGEFRLAALIAGYISVANPIDADVDEDVANACEMWPETYEAGVLAARHELTERSKRYDAGWKAIKAMSQDAD